MTERFTWALLPDKYLVKKEFSVRGKRVYLEINKYIGAKHAGEKKRIRGVKLIK